MSDTPRTDDCDKAHAHYIYPVQYDFMRSHADTLERELAAATARVAELTDKDLCKMGQSPCEYALTLIARAESAERDALQRAAEVCKNFAEAEQSFYEGSVRGFPPLGGGHVHRYANHAVETCRNRILALISKEKA